MIIYMARNVRITSFILYLINKVFIFIFYELKTDVVLFKSHIKKRFQILTFSLYVFKTGKSLEPSSSDTLSNEQHFIFFVPKANVCLSVSLSVGYVSWTVTYFYCIYYMLHCARLWLKQFNWKSIIVLAPHCIIPINIISAKVTLGIILPIFFFKWYVYIVIVVSVVPSRRLTRQNMYGTALSKVAIRFMYCLLNSNKRSDKKWKCPQCW